MDLGLGGLNAVVTGGTRGIGRAIADTLADEGANVAICARHADDVEAAVAALRAKGVRAIGRALDVGDGPALQAWVRDVGQRARRHRHRGVQRVGAGHRRRRGALAARVRGRHAGHGPARGRGDAEPRAVRRPVHRHDLERLRPRDRLRLRRRTARSRRRSCTTRRASPTTSPARASGRTPSRRATPTSTAACGSRSRQATPSSSRRRSASTRPGGWARRRRWPTPSRSSPARAASFITGANLVVDGALTKGVQL